MSTVSYSFADRLNFKNEVLRCLLIANHFTPDNIEMHNGVYYLVDGDYETFAGYCKDDVIDYLEQIYETKGSPS